MRLNVTKTVIHNFENNITENDSLRDVVFTFNPIALHRRNKTHNIFSLRLSTQKIRLKHL